jgi:apolipoprotein D and lipocalin family protein
MAMALMACPRNGPRPEVVEKVDIERYVGLWHEIASNPVFFNRDLVSVTAEYAIIDEKTVSVLNKGRKNTPDGPQEQIEGKARVVDRETNAKLAVSFDSVFFSRIFKGEYWIVLLDEAEYQYAVVTDSRQSTMFVLYRDPEMPRALYDEVIAALEAKDINTRLLRITGTLSS